MGEGGCAGGGGNGIVSHWKRCQAQKGVLKKKKGGLVVLGCAIGRMHPQIECRPSQFGGSLMRGVSSLVSPQPQTAVRYRPRPFLLVSLSTAQTRSHSAVQYAGFRLTTALSCLPLFLHFSPILHPSPPLHSLTTVFPVFTPRRTHGNTDTVPSLANR